jgi:hypothetical protein
MLVGGRVVPGLTLLSLVCLATACTAGDDPEPTSETGVAIASYRPPAAAPEFCSLLAGSAEITGLPPALGRLAVTTRDVEAQLSVTGAVEELRGVLSAVREDGEHRLLESELDRLVTALVEARDGEVDEQLAGEVSDALDAVGERVQPICRFPE